MKVNSNSTQAFNLNNVDPEEIGDVLVKIERSFNIRLDDTSCKDVKTFGKLCDIVVEKVKQTNNDSCTTQQAFYKIRNAINSTISPPKELIKPQTKLADIFPRDTRLQVIAEIEREMGFKINLLQPKQGIVGTFLFVLLASAVGFFYQPVMALIGAIVAITGLMLAGKFGKELKVKTLGDLAEKVAREHYIKCRKDASTVNRNEISQKVKELFTADLYLEPSVLTRDAKF
ncbi:YtxH domain-containing protein [Mucilaginibacter sp. HC2]|uniref:YtxH domain-containing protein n=1 Tax=Mucilaginibacter inviolabilis TaxID=2714892 RepID=UPI00140782AE|nr:YtxH domain-containing protein [Mucilaginibacter inviolabilis]NHA06725.1 YtxH domain-containing protein [Mucilaginibacter inviolabilis]